MNKASFTASKLVSHKLQTHNQYTHILLKSNSEWYKWYAQTKSELRLYNRVCNIARVNPRLSETSRHKMPLTDNLKLITMLNTRKTRKTTWNQLHCSTKCHSKARRTTWNYLLWLTKTKPEGFASQFQVIKPHTHASHTYSLSKYYLLYRPLQPISLTYPRSSGIIPECVPTGPT